MYSQPEDIMEKYDLTVEQITKGRGAYICNTNQGMKLLMPFRGSKERAEFLRVFLKYMQEAGFLVEQILLTHEGDPLAEDESGEKYILKDMFTGNECSTRNWDEMKEAVKILAFYHKISKGCPLEIPEFMINTGNQLPHVYEKHMRELVMVKNYVRNKKRKNEFEQKFQTQYPHFMEHAKEAMELLESRVLVKEDRLLCHGDFNQHNILKTRDGWQMIHFEHLAYQNPMVDLANFLRKMLEKNNWKQELGMELIASYDMIQRIGEQDYKQLYIMLRFPEKFWKLANHYSNSHKAWLSNRDLEKLDKVIAQEESKEQFLQKLFSFIG